MAEVLPNNYAPLDPANLYALIHGEPRARPESVPEHAHAAHGDVDRFEPETSLQTGRHRLPDCSVDLEYLHQWRARAKRIRALDPEEIKRETAHAQALGTASSPEALQVQREGLRQVLRHQLNRAPHHLSRRLPKLKRCVLALRINLRASGWPGRYLPLQHSQYEAHTTGDWLEQLQAWDQAIIR